MYIIRFFITEEYKMYNKVYETSFAVLVIKIFVRNVSLSMCVLALPTFQSDWYWSPLSEAVRAPGPGIVM